MPATSTATSSLAIPHAPANASTWQLLLSPGLLLIVQCCLVPPASCDIRASPTATLPTAHHIAPRIRPRLSPRLLLSLQHCPSFFSSPAPTCSWCTSSERGRRHPPAGGPWKPWRRGQGGRGRGRTAPCCPRTPRWK